MRRAHPHRFLTSAQQLLVYGVLSVFCAGPLWVAAAAHLPRDAFPPIAGWVVKAEPTVYGPETLWDFIDGAADLYLSYAFVDLHVAYYTNREGIEVRAELYRHDSSEDAYGIYSQERSPESPPAPFGCEGYLDSGMLNYVCGPVYVKLSSNQEGDSVAPALATVAGTIEVALGGPTSMPGGFSLLPRRHRVARSEQYIARDFLGYGFLRRAFVARYGENGACRAFVLREDQSSDIQRILASFASVATLRPADDGEGSQVFDDPHVGAVTVVVHDNMMFGIIECRSDEIRSALVLDFQHSL